LTRIVSSLGKGKEKITLVSNISNISNIKSYIKTMVNIIILKIASIKRRENKSLLKLVMGLLTTPLLIIAGFIEVSLLGGFFNNPEN
jgi:hypothetical protein